MEKNINIVISQFDENIKSFIQSSNLPIGVVYYILKNLTQQIEMQYYATLNSILTQQTEEKIIETSEEQ